MKQYFKDPLSSEPLGLVSSIGVLVASVFVNAYFLKTSFAAMVSWMLDVARGSLVGQAVQRMSAAGVTYASRIPFGLLMTVFVLIFLVPAACLARRGQHLRGSEIVGAVGGAMTVPVVLLLVSGLLMNASFVAGVVLAVFAAACVFATIVTFLRAGNVNGWAICAWGTLFLLITVVMCARNHMVTMFGV